MQDDSTRAAERAAAMPFETPRQTGGAAVTGGSPAFTEPLPSGDPANFDILMIRNLQSRSDSLEQRVRELEARLKGLYQGTGDEIALMNVRLVALERASPVSPAPPPCAVATLWPDGTWTWKPPSPDFVFPAVDLLELMATIRNFCPRD